MSRLIINNVEIELSPSKPIARTLQVNDIATLNNRQTNFTPTFSIPRTANNVKAMTKLGVVGTNSNIPYQRNSCYYYSESGECLVYNGWAIITSTAKDYKCNVYDGNIDIYKSIENATLNSLPLDEINHVKTLDNVIDSINGLTTYKYILADYNGKTLYDTDKINIDYLVPSVPVSYLWDKIFEFYGYTYSGSVFDTFAFQNLYMTFPKGIGSTIPDVAIYESNDLDFVENDEPFADNTIVLKKRKSTYLKQNSNTLNDLNSISDGIHFYPNSSGLFRIEVTGSITSYGYVDFRSIGGDVIPAPLECSLWLAKNSDGILNSDNVTLIQLLQSNIGSDYSFAPESINVNSIISLDENESFCLVLRYSGTNVRFLSYVIEDSDINLNVSKVESQTIDFSGAFIDFKTKDFLNEVLTRFGLTPFKDKYSNNYRFLTLYELLQNNDVVDWSASKNKFVEQTNESYTYGSYAQKNDLTYKYNDAEGDYYNGSLTIDNVNLPDNKVVINSRIYAPEKIKTNVLQKETNVYKLWNKELKDNGDVTYKSLDKRFYFMRADNFIFDGLVTIGSETLAIETTIGQAPFESFYKLPFNDVVQDFYLPMYQILNKSKVCDINVYLTEQDVANIDFSKLYWIEELNSYFILNKINNFSKKGVTKCEMIKVDYVNTLNEGFNLITITYDTDSIIFSGYDATYPIRLQSSLDGVTWSNEGGIITTNEIILLPIAVTTFFRVVNLSDEVISNVLIVEI